MNPLEGTWELAVSEESLGDLLFFSGQPGAGAHYQAAQRALMPQGVTFSSREEYDRRMEAYQRIVQKVYEIGGDGRARGSQKAEPEAPAVKPIPFANPNRSQSEVAKVLLTDDWWANHRLGDLWLAAAKVLAAEHPEEARAACEWSLDYFEKYSLAWTAHLPASRWDSDGGLEMMEANGVVKGLEGGPSPSPAPAWVRWLLAGDWRESLAALDLDAEAARFQPMLDILAQVRKLVQS